MPNSSPPPERSVFQVSELVGTLKHGLEMNFPGVWVDGEISNFLAARSGHWYFTLKDDRAQIRCAFFRNRNLRTPEPENGQRCLLRGKPSIYTARGELQLIVEELEDAGAGALHLAFERLKRKLADEGLFAASRKLPLPATPRCIGLITSAQGAAVHDVLKTLARRNPLLRVVLYPVPVQGADAPRAIVQALDTARRRDECDVVLLTRGGGSLEDLQAFNDEALARAIAEFPLPTLSAVGHEVDFSITDFVASERAATPTAAAERLSPDSRHWQQRIDAARSRLQQQLRGRTTLAADQLRALRARLLIASPRRRLQDRAQLLDDLQRRLHQQTQLRLQAARRDWRHCRQRLRPAELQRRLDAADQQHRQLRQRLQQAVAQQLRQQQLHCRHLHRRLQDLGPQDVLRRGYSITWRDAEVVRDPAVEPGQALRVQVHGGDIWVEVKKPNA